MFDRRKGRGLGLQNNENIVASLGREMEGIGIRETFRKNLGVGVYVRDMGVVKCLRIGEGRKGKGGKHRENQET